MGQKQQVKQKLDKWFVRVKHYKHLFMGKDDGPFEIVEGKIYPIFFSDKDIFMTEFNERYHTYYLESLTYKNDFVDFEFALITAKDIVLGYVNPKMIEKMYDCVINEDFQLGQPKDNPQDDLSTQERENMKAFLKSIEEKVISGDINNDYLKSIYPEVDTVMDLFKGYASNRLQTSDRDLVPLLESIISGEYNLEGYCIGKMADCLNRISAKDYSNEQTRQELIFDLMLHAIIELTSNKQ